MDTPRTLRISLIAILALGCAARADAFIAGDPCVSPYVIADGDIASLRAAIACANTDGTDSVVELATNGSYVFTSADTSNSTRALNSIGANGAFTLLGHGATLHRDAASVDSFGILEVSNSAVVEINEVTLSGGLATAFGGGMRIRGAVRASSIRVVDNVSTAAGGGIMLSNNGTLVLTDSTVANNTSDADGAGVRVSGGSSLWMNRSTIQGNTITGFGAGAGIQSDGVARILNSTIIDNVVTESTRRGGGIEVNTGGDVTIVNSTFYDNVSPAPGEQVRRSGGTLDVYNSILGESTSDAVSDCSNATSATDTLIYDGSCGATITGSLMFLDRGTGANGTEVLPLSFGSTAAIGAANNDWLSEGDLGIDLNGDGDQNDDFQSDIDQSGKPRGVGTNTDLGAVEYACSTLGDHYAATASELVEAIACANFDSVDSTVELVSDTYTFTVAENTDGDFGGTALPRIIDDGDLTIVGHQALIERDPDAGEDFRILFVDTDLDTVVLQDVAIEGGRLAGSSHRGGGIYNRGNLQLHRSVVRGNSTRGFTGRGGGIQNLGNLLLSHSLIDGNATFDDGSLGGGLNNEGSGIAILVNSTVTRNMVASTSGGGIRSDGDDTVLLLVNSTIAYNETDGAANEISVFDGTVLSCNTVVATVGSFACEGGGSLSYLVDSGMASDASCGATFTADPQLGALNQNVFVPYYPLSGNNVDTVDTGNSECLDEALVDFDLNGDGDTDDDLGSGVDQAGNSRIDCSSVDLGAVEFQDCAASHTVGGSVSGLASGNSVGLTLNGSATVDVTSNGTFAFPVPLGYGQSYFVSVSTQPTSPNQTCTVSNASGQVGADDVTSIVVNCVTDQYTIGGSVSGLAAGSQLVLRNNDGDDLTLSADGAFTFPTALDDGSSYAVTVFQQPTNPDQVCTVASGTGTVSGAAVNDVAVTCSSLTMDLVASITDGQDAIVAGGGLLTYTIVITNNGPADAIGASVVTESSEALSNENWTCTADAGATCPASGGSEIETNVDLPAGTSVTFHLTGEISPSFMDVIESSVSVSAPDGYVELTPADNTATDQTSTDRIFADGFESPIAP